MAYRILNNENSIKEKANIEYARFLLRSFVLNFQKIYKLQYVSNIIHSLIHTPDDVEFFQKTLIALSAYPFESRLGFVSKLTKSGNRPATQVARRIHEMNKFDVCQEMKKRKFGPDQPTGNGTFNTLRTEEYTFDNGLANRYCEINHNSVFVISHFAKINDENHVFGMQVQNLQPLYERSTHFDEYKVSVHDINIMSDENIVYFPKEQITGKFWCIPFLGEEYALSKLVHCEFISMNHDFLLLKNYPLNCSILL